MSSSANPGFEQRPVLVVALGGNALSPPIAGADHYQQEREIIARTGASLEALAGDAYRLVVVHGNGPQVGRLLQSDPDPDPTRSNLDIHVAQTQGELGYLLAQAMPSPSACIMTRVVVEAELGQPVKPIGPILAHRPDPPATSTPVAGGWRLVVPSPKPNAILETNAIATLLQSHHVIAGGGGGVPLASTGAPISAVVDKDWVASLLAMALDAQHVVFATDVDHVYRRYGAADAQPLQRLTTADAVRLRDAGELGAGSMAPKVLSAAEFAEATGRSAHICALDEIQAALRGAAGTVISPAG